MKKSDFPRSKSIKKFKKLKNGLFKITYKETKSRYASIIYFNKNGLRHREDGPAAIYSNGLQCYYKNGLLHREDGPTAIYPDGAKLYYKNGLRHREDGPAVIYSDGKKEYYKNGKWLNIIIKIKKTIKLEF